MRLSATSKAPSLRTTRTPGVLWVCAIAILLGLFLGACDRWPFKGESSAVRKTLKQTKIFDRGPRGCETACATASASRHELKLLFGVDDLPPDLLWGRTYVDGPGFKAFRMCIGDDEPKGKNLEYCFEKAHKICVISCIEEETKLLAQQPDRHSQRDEARQEAREKPAPP
jgi:hypothetical protein